MSNGNRQISLEDQRLSGVDVSRIYDIIDEITGQQSEELKGQQEEDVMLNLQKVFRGEMGDEWGGGASLLRSIFFSSLGPIGQWFDTLLKYSEKNKRNKNLRAVKEIEKFEEIVGETDLTEKVKKDFKDIAKKDLITSTSIDAGMNILFPTEGLKTDASKEAGEEGTATETTKQETPQEAEKEAEK